MSGERGSTVWRRILSSFDPATNTVVWYTVKEIAPGLYRYVYEVRPYEG